MTKKKSDEAETMMQSGVKETLEIAKESGYSLDFSDESIKDIEKLLCDFHNEYKNLKSEEGFHGLAIMVAGYIGEVIRKKGFGGSWERDHPHMGENSFPFHWRGEDLFLYAWCAKRIFDGSGDNVWFKYKTLVLDKLGKATKG